MVAAQQQCEAALCHRRYCPAFAYDAKNSAEEFINNNESTAESDEKSAFRLARCLRSYGRRVADHRQLLRRYTQVNDRRSSKKLRLLHILSDEITFNASQSTVESFVHLRQQQAVANGGSSGSKAPPPSAKSTTAQAIGGVESSRPRSIAEMASLWESRISESAKEGAITPRTNNRRCLLILSLILIKEFVLYSVQLALLQQMLRRSGRGNRKRWRQKRQRPVRRRRRDLWRALSLTH